VTLNLTAEAHIEIPALRLVEFIPGWALYESFSVTWDDPALPAIVKIDVEVQNGRPTCRGIAVSGRGSEQVDGGVLRRLPVAALLDHAVAVAVMRGNKPGEFGIFKTPEDFRAFRELRPVHRERERWQLTSEHLAEVAKCYSQASRAPVMAVARHFNKPRATASRWIAKARAEGFFDGV
jgi:hypothetical protein